jgi:hypothetical protein
MTNIFICWASDRSQLLGKALREHLPRLIPGLPPSSLFISGQQMKENINEFLMFLAGLAPDAVAAAG